jgi:hypothetical protein
VNSKKSILLGLIFVLAAGLPLAASAQLIRIEGENFTNSHDIALQLIRPFALTGCSSGYVLYGLDAANEWVEYDIPVSSFGVYSITLSQKANDGQDYTFQGQLHGQDSGEIQNFTVDFRGSGYL